MAPGHIIRDPDMVQQEVLTYFDTLFQGHHQATAAGPEPRDSGRPFELSLPEEVAADFLNDMSSLSPAQALDRPFVLSELQTAVAAAAKSNSPGLDGLSYELHAAVIDLVGPGLLQAFNAMLQEGLLTPSFSRGVVRLLPIVAGVPFAAQLRPITLLNTDYKLLTKMFAASFAYCSPILPALFCPTPQHSGWWPCHPLCYLVPGAEEAAWNYSQLGPLSCLRPC
jgi:hypothetical protein